MLTDRVIKSKDRDKILYIVEYYDNNGKRIRKKQFNATRYGEENAKWMANKWR